MKPADLANYIRRETPGIWNRLFAPTYYSFASPWVPASGKSPAKKLALLAQNIISNLLYGLDEEWACDLDGEPDRPTALILSNRNQVKTVSLKFTPKVLYIGRVPIYLRGRSCGATATDAIASQAGAYFGIG
jgi:hypothetical protein